MDLTFTGCERFCATFGGNWTTNKGETELGTMWYGSKRPQPKYGARSEFFFGGAASRVPWGCRDSYGKTGNFGRVGDKSMFKMYKKTWVGREGDI